MTLKALADLKALYESASGGKWLANKYGGVGTGKYGIDEIIIEGLGWGHDWDGIARAKQAADKALIVALHNKAPALFAAMEALEECGAKWQAFREKPIIQDDDIHTITIHLDAMWARVNAALAALKLKQLET